MFIGKNAFTILLESLFITLSIHGNKTYNYNIEKHNKPNRIVSYILTLYMHAEKFNTANPNKNWKVPLTTYLEI